VKRIRLDLYLVQRSLSPTREKARRDILAGWVTVDGGTVTRPSHLIEGSEQVVVGRPGGVYVSRGGQKLEHALTTFGIDLHGRTCVDLGASTGGFTDCMLRAGAAVVYAVDVGYGQLDFSLRRDARVRVMDRTNVRNLKASDFPEKIDFAAVDLSFISIRRVFDAMRGVFAPFRGVILIKPQFEAGRGQSKKGVVRRKEDHERILVTVLSSLAHSGMSILGLTYSPVKGPKGNIEFLLYFECEEKEATSVAWSPDKEILVKKAVGDAHRGLGR
jgi:23S rRNA (cytidine1920-2'-O)/16S rRNA (cytidine1409-2'-O)-methyltransferase